MKLILSRQNGGKIGRKLRSSTLRLVIITLLVTALPMIGLFSFNYLKDSITRLNTISGQIIQQLDLNTSNVITSCSQIPNDHTLLSLLKNKDTRQNRAHIENRLMELCGNGSGIKSIILNCDGGIYHSVFISDSQMREILDSPWYLNLKELKYLRYFSAPDKTDGTFHYSMRLDDSSYLTGEMIVTLRADDLDQILNSANKTFDHYIWIDNQNNPLIDHAFDQKDYLFETLAGDRKNSFYDEYIFYNQKGIFIAHYSDITRWKFIAFVPYSELLIPFLPTFFVLLLSIAFIMLLSGAILKPLIQNIVSPLELLSEHMRDFSYEDASPVDIHTGDEIEALSDAFNEMSLELKKHVEMLLAKQQNEQKLEYGLRISQINPHFIYNTMNTINYLARKNRTEDIVVINNALIHIMKDSLRINETSVFDTVDTELKVTEQYLKIQEYRYEEQIKIIWDIDPDARRQMIPKHILQPLVENAIIHGFLENELESFDQEMPFIRIRICLIRQKTQICLEVEDNGVGIDLDNYEKICKESKEFDASSEYSRGQHIGIANIRWRLSYLLKEEQEFKIVPRSPHGTIVTLILPAGQTGFWFENSALPETCY
ncbi:histidine kinase [Lachnospiraceae bacterium JLR.KK008]